MIVRFPLTLPAVPSLHLRPASVADTPVILALIRGLAEYERLPEECTVTEEQLRASLFGEYPQAEVILARLDDDVAGFALFFHNYSTFLGRHGLYLEDLFVWPRFRGQGIGRALLSRLARIALDRGCGRFEWSVLDWNEPAIGFYKRLGAVAMNDWTVYRVTDSALERLAGDA